MKMNNTNGFTIVEILVAISLLLVLILVVLQPLISSLNITGQSKNNLQSTSDAQRDLEIARQIVITNYDNGAKIGTLLVGKPGLVCENINLFNELMPSSNCSAMDNPPLRRLTLTRRTTGSQSDDIVLQVTVTANEKR